MELWACCSGAACEPSRQRGGSVGEDQGEVRVGAAILAKQKGYEVFVSDGSSLKENYRNDLQQAGIEFEEGQHDETRILDADEVMKSPGIPEKNDLVKQIRAKGIDIISEIEFAYRYKGNSRIIAINMLIW